VLCSLCSCEASSQSSSCGLAVVWLAVPAAVMCSRRVVLEVSSGKRLLDADGALADACTCTRRSGVDEQVTEAKEMGGAAEARASVCTIARH
jgi:hypothetical protein